MGPPWFFLWPRHDERGIITSRVRPKARRKTVPVKLGALPLLAVGAVALVIFFAIWQRTQMVNAIQTLDLLGRQERVLQRRNEQLRLKLAELSSLERVEPWARRHGFREPARDQVVHVRR